MPHPKVFINDVFNAKRYFSQLLHPGSYSIIGIAKLPQEQTILQFLPFYSHLILLIVKINLGTLTVNGDNKN
ncbi:hypothetical protein P8452_19077 [Trifolium repens]|nr:hypothetical protein P8452_19077 [Trifolium repens]